MAFISGCGTSTVQTPPEKTVNISAPVDKVSVSKDLAWATFNKAANDFNSDILIIRPDKFKDLIANQESKYFFIDLREPQDYAKGHIKGAVNIPIGELTKFMDKLPTDKTIVVYCYSGQTAGMTIIPLRAAGYKVISLGKGFPGAEEVNLAIDNVPVSFTAATSRNVVDSKTAAALEGINETFNTLVKMNSNKTLIIPPADVKPLIDASPEKYAILDLRRAEDYAKAHVKGAVNIYFSDLHQKLSSLPKDKTIVLYCYSGQSSGAATVPLKLEGYKVISVGKGFAGIEKSTIFDIIK